MPQRRGARSQATMAWAVVLLAGALASSGCLAKTERADGGGADGGEVDGGGWVPTDWDDAYLADAGGPRTCSPGDAGARPTDACAERVRTKLAELEVEGIDYRTWSTADAVEMAEITSNAPQTAATYRDYDGRYRPLTNHPGCSTAGLYYDWSNTSAWRGDGNNDGRWTGDTAFGGPNRVPAREHVRRRPARIPGYPCAAVEYKQPDEDTSKPIVVLVHGNSTRPHSWEKFLLPSGTPIQSFENVQFAPDTAAREQLAERLVAARYRVIAVDMRSDLVLPSIEPMSNNNTENLAANIDHGWSTPILQGLLKALMTNHPCRKISLVGHSLGATVIRDALRRLWNDFDAGRTTLNPYEHVSHVVLGSGAMHGVSTYESLCQQNANRTMRGTVGCEMGSRTALVPTYFNKPLNGPRDLFATPCADGDFAFGKRGQCGGNVVKYYTITMQDIVHGTQYQDLYVSEGASRIDMEGCVTNTLTSLQDYDTSGYFLKGMIANHFGSVRSTKGLELVMQYLGE